MRAKKQKSDSWQVACGGQEKQERRQKRRKVAARAAPPRQFEETRNDAARRPRWRGCVGRGRLGGAAAVAAGVARETGHRAQRGALQSQIARQSFRCGPSICRETGREAWVGVPLGFW